MHFLMGKRRRPWIIVPFLLILGFSALADERMPRAFDAVAFNRFVENTRQAYAVPGAVVVIVNAEGSIFAKGYGVREQGKPGPCRHRYALPNRLSQQVRDRDGRRDACRPRSCLLGQPGPDLFAADCPRRALCHPIGDVARLSLSSDRTTRLYGRLADTARSSYGRACSPCAVPAVRSHVPGRDGLLELRLLPGVRRPQRGRRA